ncbi:MAG: dUTP diphosphatase [Candidatus Thorarchaeota archaeon]|nr:MAG: dUTP diphosphatase [Candidatus Thorarchaeota archaeon]
MGNDTVTVRVKRLSPDAVLPRKAKEGDVAFDLFSAVDCELQPGMRKPISTGLAMEIPKGFEGQVRPRSGLAMREGITTLNTPGTIDSGYRGEVKVILINHGEKSFKVEKGMRIAQLAVRSVPKVEFVASDTLEDTERGEDGFGSTGL